jgi:hypothetical protein
MNDAERHDWSVVAGGRLDLALASMSRIIDPYARLFKLDNPIAHQGCGPGMYSQMGSR